MDHRGSKKNLFLLIAQQFKYLALSMEIFESNESNNKMNWSKRNLSQNDLFSFGTIDPILGP